MNLSFSAFNLQELEQLVTTLFAENKCACHVINPHKTRILMWKEVKDNQTTYHLRIGIQKFSSQEQLDRNGEIYWRFGSYEVKKEEVKEDSSNQEANKNGELATPAELDPITKFQQRQAKAINHGKPDNTEPAINNFQSD